MVLPKPPSDQAMIVVYREYAELTRPAAKVNVDATQICEVPQQAFAYATREHAGKKEIALCG